MSNALDKLLLSSQERSNPITTVDAFAFFTGIRKMAEEETAAPETTGATEGPFLAPLPTVVELMAQMIANEFKTQTYYVFYANMLRGLSHEGVAEEFMEHAGHELEHANYLLRRMGVLSPGGVPIPAYPPPKPLSDPNEIIQEMIIVEQMGISLWKQLLAVMGDNPMRYTVEEFLQREEEHQDELWQLVEAPTLAPTPQPLNEEPAEAPKTAMEIVVGAVRRKLAAEAQTAKTPWAGSAVGGTLGTLGGAMLGNHLGGGGNPMTALMGGALGGALGLNLGNVADLENRGRQQQLLDMLQQKQAAVLITEKAMALRREADAIHAKDQMRVEAVPQTESQLQAAAPFIVKKVDNTAKPKGVTPVTPSTGLLEKLDLAIKKSNFSGPTPSPEEYVQQEQQLNAEQAMAEAAHAKTISMQSAQAAQQAQAEAAAAQQQLQETQAALENAQMSAQQGSTQMLQATQQAAEAEARATQTSVDKMQLGMRVNQLRQELANLVMQDPVAEHAATVSDLAAQGQPATPQQQQDADAMAQQQAAGAVGPDGQPSGETEEQQGEAQNAKAHAETQQAQADQSAQKDQSKAASVFDDVATRTGKVIGRGAVDAVTSSVAEGAKKHAPALVAGGAGALGLGALAHQHGRTTRKRDMSDAVAEGMHRAMAKSAATPNRRLARAVMEGANDTLGNELRNVLKKHMPGEAAQAAVGAKVKELISDGAGAVAKKGPGLLDRAKPHAPGFLGGLGVGALGMKAMTPDASTSQGNTYDQYFRQ